MTTIKTTPKTKIHPLQEYIDRMVAGEALLVDTPDNVLEVVGILKSYGVVLEAYYKNLLYISENQFLEIFPFFKYFNGEITFQKLLRHWWHDRINFEYAEYCMKAMFWHGATKLDSYLDSPEFEARARDAIAAKFKFNPFLLGVNATFKNSFLELVRQQAYYSALGQFWDVMSEMFLTLSDRYDRGEIKTIPDVVQHILDGLVASASKPIIYSVKIGDKTYDLIPEREGITFLMDTAVPYVEAVFFRGTPFSGTVSYNAQAQFIPPDQGRFQYGALYADPLPIGGAGIPPTLLMQDMRHYLPDYLHKFYENTLRGESDLRVKICQTFQKSMFCVTTAAIKGLAPFPLDTQNPEERAANQKYLAGWMDRFMNSRLLNVNSD